MPRGEQLLDQSCYHDNKERENKDDEEQEGKSNKVLIAGSHVVIINFVKSAFINNPIIVSYDLVINNDIHCPLMSHDNFFRPIMNISCFILLIVFILHLLLVTLTLMALEIEGGIMVTMATMAMILINQKALFLSGKLSK